MKSIYNVFLVVVGAFLISTSVGQEASTIMTKITTRMIEPASKTITFMAQPKTLWRAGTKYACIAEAPDAQNHIHGLMIINGADAWMINLVDKSGRHTVDTDPPFNVHIPIFQVSGEAKEKLEVLEFGSELEFFSRNSARQSAGEVINGKATDRYDATVSGSRLTLWTDAKSQKPVRISLTTGTETQTIEYLAYEDDLQFDPSLFRPPSGIAMQDSK